MTEHKKLYTPDMAGSGQFGICANCGLHPAPGGHDGCLGELVGLMNACCGHGDDNQAYIQFLDGKCVRGQDAIEIQRILIRCDYD